MFKSIFSIVMSFLIVSSTLSVIFPFSNTNAQSADSLERILVQQAWEERPLKDQIVVYQVYLALSECFAAGKLKDGNDNRINPVNATKFQWFNEPSAVSQGTIVYLGENLVNRTVNVLGADLNAGSAVSCYSSENIKKLLGVLGEKTDDAVSVLCRLGFDRNKIGGTDGAGGGCLSNGEGDYYWKGMSKDTQLETFRNLMSARFWGGSTPYLTVPAQYQRYSDLFSLCASPYSGGAANAEALQSGDRAYFIYTIDNKGVRSQEKVFYYGSEGSGKKQSDFVATGGGSFNVGVSFNPVDLLFSGIPQAQVVQGGVLMANAGSFAATRMSCAQVEEKINELSSAYATYVQTALEAGQNLGDIIGDTNNDCAVGEICGEKTESTCGIDGIGWIICPALTFLAGITDEAFNVIEQFLQINPALLDQESDTYAFWQVMRDFANIAFVIVFLIIIFSQLTSLGVSNYGVKKTLPRLIVGAILVNISFFVCQLAVDISNITGASIYQVLTSLPTGAGGEDASGNVGGWVVVIASAILAGSAAILAISVPVLLAALLAVAVILLILMARFAIVIMLTVLAPLAFVALLLPNTEPLFKKWLKLFTSMLVLYPIVALVFGASTIAAQIIANAGGEINDGFLQVTALGVAALPLILIPSILKNSLNAAGTLGTKLGNLSSKANSRIGSKVSSTSRLGESQRALSQRMVQRRAQRRSNSKIASTVDQSRFGRAMGWNKGAAVAGEIASKAESENVAAVENQIRQRSVSDPGHAQVQLEKALKSGDTVAAKAAQNVLFSQGSSGFDAFHSTISSVGSKANSSTVDGLRSNITEKHGQVTKSKAADMIKWAAVGGTIDSHTTKADTWSGLSAADLSTQTEGSMRRASEAGHISADTARELLDNQQLRTALGPEQAKIIEGVAGRSGGGGGKGPGPIGSEAL